MLFYMGFPVDEKDIVAINNRFKEILEEEKKAKPNKFRINDSMKKVESILKT